MRGSDICAQTIPAQMYRTWVAVGRVSEQPQLAAASILFVVASPAIVALGIAKNFYWPIASRQFGKRAGIRMMSSKQMLHRGA